MQDGRARENEKDVNSQAERIVEKYIALRIHEKTESVRECPFGRVIMPVRVGFKLIFIHTRVAR